jgi:hypothetical protein
MYYVMYLSAQSCQEGVVMWLQAGPSSNPCQTAVALMSSMTLLCASLTSQPACSAGTAAESRKEDDSGSCKLPFPMMSVGQKAKPRSATLGRHWADIELGLSIQAGEHSSVNDA